MANTMDTRVDAFIADNKLSQTIKESVYELINGCIADLVQHIKHEPVPETQVVQKPKSEKKTKENKVEDVSLVKDLDELRSFTTQELNQFCKDNNLKIGGNKKEIMERVLRFNLGNTSDDDLSSRSKPKKEKKDSEKFVCAAKNAKGEPCSTAATDPHGGLHFCWRHIKEADKWCVQVEEIEPVKLPGEDVAE